MISRLFLRSLLLPIATLLLISMGAAQTIEIDGQRVEMNPNGAKSAKPNRKDQQAKPSGGFGWGSNIGVARESRAAEQALKAGNYAQATAFAQQAANSSPTDPNLWFLLGYAARLGGRTQLSFDAYNRGLQLQPNSIDGLSGLAQTYIKAGNGDEGPVWP